MELDNSMEYNRSDLILRHLLEEEKTITGFLNAVFGFLKRNTDFYQQQTDENDKWGFPEGVKERIVLNSLKKYEVDYDEYDLSNAFVPYVDQEVEVITSNNTPPKDAHLNNTANEKSEIMKECFNVSDYKNGALYENYCWSQTLKDVELYVKMPQDVKSSKQIKVESKSQSIFIERVVPKKLTILDGTVWSKFKYNDVVWTLTDGKLHLSLDKCHQKWWDKFFVTEPSIDITKLEHTVDVDELPPESQSMINKLRIQEIEKRPVKSSSRINAEKLELLRKAWDVDGSPFKGQPFDPSLIQFD